MNRRLAAATPLTALLVILGGTLLAWAGEAARQPEPLLWVGQHWTGLVTALAAFFLVHYVRRIDGKFQVLFDWKTGVDLRLGVHDEVWNHGDGCGPLWVHHRSDGASALHFRSSDHPGLCERCRELQGHVLPAGSREG